MFGNIISTNRSNITFKPKPEPVIGDTPKRLRPWEVLDYPAEKQQAIYLGWGRHCARQQEMQMAEKYINQALDIEARDATALYSRSVCKRSLAETQDAFDDSLRATYLEPLKTKFNHELLCTLYELNEFEAASVEAHNIARLFAGPFQKKFQEFSTLMFGHLDDCLGDSVGYFFIQRNNHCYEVLEEYRQKNLHISRPMWKILRDRNECDVVSIPTVKQVLVHPLEKARRDNAFKAFYQNYLRQSWIDVLSLRAFAKSDVLNLKAFRESTQKIQELLTAQNSAVKKFAKMLHARRPLYCELQNIASRRKLWEQCREKNLYIIQYMTRRNMFIILREIQHLRKIGAIEKLVQCVEKAMGDYIIRKTFRVAPWKFEFMEEVYNLLALAYADLCIIPPNLSTNQRDALEKILNLPVPTDFVLGDKEGFSFKPREKPEKSKNSFKLFLRRMEKRLIFSKHSIEKAYIYHEIALGQFANNFFNDCAAIALKGFNEAMNCNHYLYAYLCTLLVARSHASNFKIDKSFMEIQKAENLAQHLRSEQLMEYTSFIKTLIEMKISEQKSQQKVLEKKSRHRGSNYSNSSNITNFSDHSVFSAQSKFTQNAFENRILSSF